VKVTVCQLDNRSDALEPMLAELGRHIKAENSDFLLLPEMCFHQWLAADRQPVREHWLASVDAHARQILQLGQLGARAIIGTRPIVTDSGAFRNQAYLWTAEPRVLPVHEKYYLPDEESYWEASWYQRGELEFETCRALEIEIGVQICTEMWFFEWARHFARAGADVLCIPSAACLYRKVARRRAGRGGLRRRLVPVVQPVESARRQGRLRWTGMDHLPGGRRNGAD
jgi:N-carbamoylputrescine amidase